MTENLVEKEAEQNVSEQQAESKKWKCKGLKCFCLIFTILAALFVIFCASYVPKTPEYALYKTFESIKTHNYEQASYYVNIDKIAENRFNEIKENALNDPEIANNPFAGLAYMFIDAMKDQVVKLVNAGFKKVVEEPNPKIDKVSRLDMAGFLIVKSYNGVTLSKDMSTPGSAKFQLDVKDKDPIQFVMNKVDKTWQIVDITGYNLIEE